MTEELIAFRASPEHDPQGTDVHAVLETHLWYQHTKAARYFWVHLLAVFGALGWLCVLLPGVVPARVGEVGLALWGACGVLVMVMAAREWKWSRRRARLLAQKTIEQVCPGP
jgi:hypothetical protein